jgi:hypothetical protein
VSAVPHADPARLDELCEMVERHFAEAADGDGQDV